MMPTENDRNSSLAVLIDADNAKPDIIDAVLTEIAKLGIASVKRIYGNWTTPQLGPWKAKLLDHSIHPIQQFGYTTGKNATDSAMIIDAMDLLYTGNHSGFCIVSSDSDFTRLASRIRETGCRVYGFGEQKTPKPFVAACDRFIYTDVLTTAAKSQSGKVPMKPRSAKNLRADSALIAAISAAIEAQSDDSGWAQLGPIGSYLNKTKNDFDPRNYGFAKLSGLVKAIGIFEVKLQDSQCLVRAKETGK